MKWLDYGRDNYAGVTWSDVPEDDGRRLFIGWMSNWDYAQVVPTQKWRSAMTLPRSLHLIEAAEGLIVASRPVEELNVLKEESIRFGEATLDSESVFQLNVNEPRLFKPPLHIQLKVDRTRTSSQHFGIAMENIAGDRYHLGFYGGQLYSDRVLSGQTNFEKRFAKKAHFAPVLTLEERELVLDVYIDHSSVEIFLNQGIQVMTEQVFPKEDFNSIYLFNEEKQLVINGFSTSTLKGIWAE